MGESSHELTLEQHGKQIEEILNHLDDLPLDRIKRIEDDVEGLGKGRIIIQQDYNQMRIEFQKSRSQVFKLQRKLFEQRNKIAFAHYGISNLEHVIEEIQTRQQTDQEDFLNAISKTSNNQKDHANSTTLKDFKNTLKHQKEELTLVELGSHLRIEESLKVQDNDKPKGKNVYGPSVNNMMEPNKSFRYNDNKGKRKHQETKVDPNIKAKPTCWKYGKTGHIKRDCKGVNVGSKTNDSGTSDSGNGLVPLEGQNMFNKSF
uniref:Zinc finger, CCHC-type n=1 Tax=Tanacetum cinerariifolium TaxID=118510 RepID=A0A6L2P119_TANCI|nr:zinc finger, CCHC-type [Tanacetum cinerariifolium]